MPIEKKRQREKKFDNEQMRVEKYGGGLGFGNSNSGNKKINIPGTTGKKNNGTDSRSARIDQLDMRKREQDASKTTSQRPGGTYQRSATKTQPKSGISWEDFRNASKTVEDNKKKQQEAVAARQREADMMREARRKQQEARDVDEFRKQYEALTRQTVRGNAEQRYKATKKRQAYEEAFKKSHPGVDTEKLKKKKMIQTSGRR